MSAPELVEQIDAAVRELVRGRRVVIVCTVLAGATRFVTQLRSYRADEILVLGLTRGTGPTPTEHGASCVICDLGPMRSVADEIALASSLVNDPPDDARTALEAFDPLGEALVYVIGFPGRAGHYLGRETIGGRPHAFETLEDKTLSAQIWDACDVPRSDEVVVPCTRDELGRTASRLDQGPGTVWSADASGGMNGGADRVFWVRSDTEARQAHEQLRQFSDQVRVMPFLEGVPCSIHGIVLPDGVAALRPVELIVLRRPTSLRFVYAGISTGWDPPAEHREEMRGVACRVGRHLADAHEYRGAFGVDGVLTADGFRPTELNPRFSGGLNTIAKGIPDLPITWLHQLVIAGRDLDVTARQVEDALVTAADAARFGSAYTSAPRDDLLDTETVLVAGDQDILHVTADEEGALGTLERGPGPHGDLVRFTPYELAPGTRLAPWGVAAFNLADRLWDTGFGPLSTAPDVARSEGQIPTPPTPREI